MNEYEPSAGNVLVKLIQKYGGLKVPEKSYDSVMSGEILAVGEGVDEKWVGRIGHWRQFKDDLRLDNNHAFIEAIDIKGTSTKG